MIKLRNFILSAFFTVSSSIGVANAADLTLANEPLFLGGVIEPNIMFTLDDSGSMQWELMPESEIRSFNWGGITVTTPDGVTYSNIDDERVLNLYPYSQSSYDGDWYYFNLDDNSPEKEISFTYNFESSNPYNVRARSSYNNTLYYDPSVKYQPWLDYDGTPLYDPKGDGSGDVPTNCAPHNPYDTSLGCRDFTQINDGSEGTSTDSYAIWFNGSNTGCIGKYSACYAGTGGFWPATYYEWDASNANCDGTINDTDCYDEVRLTVDDEKLQNFANWYSYHRSRILASRAAIGQAFAAQGNDLRVGFAAINEGSETIDGVTSNGAVTKGVRDFELTVAAGSDRELFFDNLYGHDMDRNGTPLRTALDYVGEYFERTDNAGPWAAIPGGTDTTAHETCRKSYNILMTDGYYNGSNPGYGNVDKTNGSLIYSDIDPNDPAYQYTPVFPYQDEFSDTLADVAMHYWKRDLRTDVDNKVPPSPTNPAFWQHMVTYTIGLGVEGTLPSTTVLDENGPVWPDPTAGDQQKIDDLWHAAVNSRGDFFSTSDSQAFAQQLSTLLTSITDQSGLSSASVALNSGSLFSQSTLYQARFSSEDWSGELRAISIASDGSIGAELWEAGNALNSKAHGDRRIIVSQGSTAAPFTYNSLTVDQKAIINAAATTYSLSRDAIVNYLRGDSSNEGENALRPRSSKLGDITQSAPVFVGAPQFSYPDVWSDLADTNGEPEDSNAYSTFRTQYQDRPGIIYVGANDGMLHAFDTANGTELAAFIPEGVFSNLPSLLSPDYTHRYYVDGTANVIDAYFNNQGSNNGWRSILLAGLRGGGQSIIAIDVTDPPGYTKTCNVNDCTFTLAPGQTETTIAGKVLWEFSDASDPGNSEELGFTYSVPNLIRMQDGNWYAVFGNGYNNTADDDGDGTTTNDSTTGNAVLYVVDIETGDLEVKIDTGIGTADDPTGQNRPNGLATVTPIDFDGDYIVDYIYAGDLFGNVWRFDVTSDNTGTWDNNASITKMFTALADPSDSSSAQAITTRIQVKSHPEDKTTFLLLFGTGKYIESPGDNLVTGQLTQSFYGIWDKNDGSTPSFTKSDLVQQQIVEEFRASDEIPVADRGPDFEDFYYRVTTANPVYWDGLEPDPALAGSYDDYGWYMDLCLADTPDGSGGLSCSNNQGEKQVSDAVIRAGRIIFTTLLPSPSPCDFGGTSWLMELDANTGARIDFSPFDVSGDDTFSFQDYFAYDVDGDGTPDVNIPVSGRKSKVGILPTPGILADNPNDREFKYESGSSGEIEVVLENPGPKVEGRQSWQEIRHGF